MTYALYNCRSTLTIISAKVSLSTMVTSLSVSACRYATGMYKHATYLYSYASMIAFRNTAYVQTVGDIASSFLMYVRFLLPFSQAILFTLPSTFSFRKIKEAISLVRSSFVIVLSSTGKKVFISWSCEILSVAALSPLITDLLGPYLGVYCAMMIPSIWFSLSSSDMSQYFSWVWRWMIPCLYYFPSW